MRDLQRRLVLFCAMALASLVTLDTWRTLRELNAVKERRDRFERAQVEAAASRARMEKALETLLERP